MVSNVPCNCDLFRGAQKVTCRYYPTPLYIMAICPYLKVLVQTGIGQRIGRASSGRLLIMTIFNTRFGIVLKVKNYLKTTVSQKSYSHRHYVLLRPLYVNSLLKERDLYLHLTPVARENKVTSEIDARSKSE